MKIFKKTCITLSLVSVSCFVLAKDIDQMALLEKVVQCKASAQDVAQLNRLVDQEKIVFPSANGVSVWGGSAWELKDVIKFGGVSSSVAIMNSRFSFYLRVPTSDIKRDIANVANTLGLNKDFESGDSISYTRTTGIATAAAMSSDEPDSYWVGCSYKQGAVQTQNGALEVMRK